MKSYTDIEQSKVLAKILPIESADMHYGEYCAGGEKYPIPNCDDDYNGYCCWSLAALLSVIPGGQVNKMADSNKWEASSWNDTDFDPQMVVDGFDNPVDACYAMIIKLHELKML